MTEERAKEIWPFIKAYSEDKQLQFRLTGNEYVNWLPVLPTHDEWIEPTLDVYLADCKEVSE